MSAVARWTPRRIRAATPFPKPAGAIARARAYDAGDALRERRSLIDLVLRHIAEHGDFIDRPVLSDHGPMPGRWLLVPLPFHLVEILAEFEADLADLEGGGDAEPDHDAEPELGAAEEVDQRDAWRVSTDREGNLGSLNNRIDQSRWGEAGDDSEREPDHDVERIDTQDGHGNQDIDELFARGILVTHSDLSEWRKL